MDIGRSISYVFEDKSWLSKVLIGGLLSIIPIFGWFVVFGYWVRTAQNVANGYELPLPEWNDFGGDFIRGFKAWVAMLVWAIPLIVLAFCAAIPLAAMSSSSNGALSALGGLMFVGVWGVDLILGLAIAFIAPVVIGRVVMQDNISAAFDFAGIVNVARDNAVSLLIIVGMTVALRFAASFGLILCFVGVLFTSFLSIVMLSHLYGQFWRRMGQYVPVDTSAIIPGPSV